MGDTGALTNAVKCAFASKNGAASISVILSDDVTPEHRNPTLSEIYDSAADSSGLGAMLGNAFYRQLDGVLAVVTPETRYTNTWRCNFEECQSEEARAVGGTWFELLLHVELDGMRVDLIFSNFDPVKAVASHRLH